MREVSIMPATLTEQIPLPDGNLVAEALRAARAGFSRKIVVLDDDPTGIQTVHDIPVYTEWTERTLEQALSENGRMFFILTNSRGFTVEETEQAHCQIAKNLALASEKTGVPFLVLSRGDSTLRGHYPLETETVRKILEEKTAICFDGEVIMPYFKEGGRLTIGDIHYVKAGEQLIPVGMTEFAKDTTFAYSSSDLKDWCEERTSGTYASSKIISISLEELRNLDYDGMLKKLMPVHNFGKIIVNAADDIDVEVFVTVLLRALQSGKEFMFRCAAGLVRVLGNVDRRPLLTQTDLCPDISNFGGLVIVGSHVKKTTAQLEYLLNEEHTINSICFDVETALEPNKLEQERDRVLKEAEESIRSGKTAIVYTSRKVLRLKKESTQENLKLSVHISQALTSVVTLLSVRPRFIIAKGGITSSDVGTQALAVRRAWVMGQVAPGVPVWKTGKESKFPDLSYIIFPGNVGDVDTLQKVVHMLLDLDT